MDSQLPPLQDALLPTTEGARPETPEQSLDTAPVNMSKASSPDRVRFTSPAPRTTSSMTPPPSSQAPNARPSVRTPTPPTPQLTSPPPTAKLTSQPSVLLDAAATLYSQATINTASQDDLKSMVNNLSNILRNVRLSAAHYKLQHNMSVMESQESASRMAVELAMATREIDVLQQAAEKRRHIVAAAEHTYQDSTNATNAIIMSELNRQNQLLQHENEEIRDLFDQQKRLTEHREGEIASLTEENDRLKTRIRMNRDHIAPLLEQMEHNSPRSVYGTPNQPTPRSRVSRVPSPLTNDARGQNNFEALLLADKMLSQETNTAPSTPNRAHMPRSRYGHQRGAQSMSALSQIQNRRLAQPRAEVPRTPPAYIPTNIPQSAPPAHYAQKPAQGRRQSSNSTITASSIDEEEAYTDREEDDVQESQASQAATSMLRRAPSSKMPAPSQPANLVQSKLFGHVIKSSGELEKRRLQSSEYRGSPTKRGRVDQGVGVGLGIGGLRE
jgi:hypothetical protein